MTEYTRKDIIMDPNDPRLKEAIGKKVYSSSDVNLVLNRANECEYEMTLTQIEDVDSEPFTVMNTDGIEYDADFIIIKKEEPKPVYMMFENREEFLNYYYYTSVTVPFKHLLATFGGVWIREGVFGAYRMVTAICDDGVSLGDENYMTAWDELYKKFTFLDGSPCGKEVR